MVVRTEWTEEFLTEGHRVLSQFCKDTPKRTDKEWFTQTGEEENVGQRHVGRNVVGAVVRHRETNEHLSSRVKLIGWTDFGWVRDLKLFVYVREKRIPTNLTRKTVNVFSELHVESIGFQVRLVPGMNLYFFDMCPRTFGRKFTCSQLISYRKPIPIIWSLMR